MLLDHLNQKLQAIAAKDLDTRAARGPERHGTGAARARRRRVIA